MGRVNSRHAVYRSHGNAQAHWPAAVSAWRGREDDRGDKLRRVGALKCRQANTIRGSVRAFFALIRDHVLFKIWIS